MRNNLDISSLILQLYSVILLLHDCTNNTIMEELQTQDKKYLQKIIEQNNEILKILKERSKDSGRTI